MAISNVPVEIIEKAVWEHTQTLIAALKKIQAELEEVKKVDNA